MLAHVDAGKTTLTEQMLFQARAVRSLGRVDDGSAHTDFTEFERRRGISVRAASAFLSWNGAKINVIDTPGHSDFSGETERAARAMDFAAVAVSAVEGVQAQTEVIWRALSKMGIPALFFINKTDREGADVDSVLAELAELTGRRPMRVPLHDRAALAEGCRLGFPPTVQFSVTSLGNLALQNFMNGFGTQTVAAVTTAYRIDTIILLPIINLGSAISTLVAQSRGAGDRERMGRIFSAGAALMAAVSVALTLLVIPTGSRLIALFGAGGEAVAIGHDFFLRIASFYWAFGLATAFRGYIEGLGDVLWSSCAGIAALAFRIAASYALVPFFGNMVIAYAEALSWLLLLALYAARAAHNKKLIERRGI